MKVKFIFTGLLFIGASSIQAAMPEEISKVQSAWAEAKYQTSEDMQEAVFKDLIANTRKLALDYPDQAAPKVWLAISLSTDAGVNGGFGALGKVKEAKTLLDSAEKIDPEVLNGSIYTSLGSLYYQVPGWPIAFGNAEMAEKYLKKALAINPDGIDPNFFYGDFLLSEDHPQDALKYLQKAKAAPARPDRTVSDSGRQLEVDEAIAKAKKML
jgi:tetratricopeptide (TPR) repeat protein